MLRILLSCVLITGTAVALLAEEPPASQPALIEASDRAAVDAAMDQDVVIQGVVRSAEWSRTGRVMNIEFEGAEDGLLAVVFDRTREAMDAGFGGDLAKALTGARVRLRGRIQPYGGRVEAMQGRPQIILEFPSQITIFEGEK